ncbi:MAG: radical SAM protein [Thermoanaerobaculia bacterium]|nr:radical SAM protein [Thermoanaerobaculia bacterium]
MKVAFLKPPIGGILGLEMLTFVEPLGLECVAAALEPDHECKIVDLRIDGHEHGMAKFRDFEPQVVGLQCNFTTERNRALALARQVKREVPEAYVVMGGHDASRDPRWFAHDVIDAVAVGDGEDVMAGLVDALDRRTDPAKVPGLVLNTRHGQVATGPAPARRDLDELPLPARHLIDEYADHYYINFRKPLALMETARGCPFKCNFCSVWKFHESTFREKSPERVVEELGQIRAPNIFITDDIFWMNVRRGREMARQIKASGIRKYFTVQTRTDIICKFPDLIEQWKECGDLAIFLGVEAVTDEGLDRVNKSNTADNNVRAIEILKDLGVGFTCNFIVDPAWDRDDFTRLREWIAEMATYNSGFSILTPLPGTDLWDEARREVTTDRWELYDIVHSVLPTKLPIEEFYEEYSRLWQWALKVRYQHRGRARTYLQLAGALAAGKVTVGAVRKGMNIAKVFSKPETFLVGHREAGQL